ncbi:hypothetical protein [Acetobacter sp. DsW_063]|uniref:hypothetical protein n=1 Tax=Acetobacter sp. DsW_063 TaxID=1514894 RepID=UPI0011783AAA|nr:hypothetical protein [Acetobacter sp. DsW_063]
MVREAKGDAHRANRCRARLICDLILYGGAFIGNDIFENLLPVVAFFILFRDVAPTIERSFE